MVITKNDISAEEHDRIAKAIRDAEQKTSGEVFAVVAQVSDDYFYVSSFMISLWCLLFGAILAVAGALLGSPISAVSLIVGQLAAFVSFVLLLKLRPHWRLWFVPRSIAYRRASSSAVQQFLAHGVHNTKGRSGVLLFVSLAERYAEVVADSGINETVNQDVWNTMVATLVDHAAKGELAQGFVIAVQQAGEVLAEHFPPDGKTDNELSDKLIEI